MEGKNRIPMKLDLLGNVSLSRFKTFMTYRDYEDFFKRNPNRKVIIIDMGYYDDDYLEKLIIKK